MGCLAAIFGIVNEKVMGLLFVIAGVLVGYFYAWNSLWTWGLIGFGLLIWLYDFLLGRQTAGYVPDWEDYETSSGEMRQHKRVSPRGQTPVVYQDRHKPDDECR